MDWTFHEGELARDDVRALLAQHFAEMRAGSTPSACHVLDPNALAGPAIRFITLRDRDGTLLGCGALRQLADGQGEVKSMRAADGARGQGVGSAILAHLMHMARQSGMTRISLETGDSPTFAAANRFYQREGFTPSGPFGGYRPSASTSFYARRL